MLTVLGGLAEFEHELIRTRTGEGARAVARGVRLGRRPKLSAHQCKEAIARREAGEVLADIAQTYIVSHSTINRLHRPVPSCGYCRLAGSVYRCKIVSILRAAPR